MAAQRVRISCTNKSRRYNPHERIVSVGGVNADNARWTLSQPAAIERVEAGTWSFYVMAGGREVDVIVAVSRFGHRYLKPEADREQPNHLLSLPECP